MSRIKESMPVLSISPKEQMPVSQTICIPVTYRNFLSPSSLPVQLEYRRRSHISALRSWPVKVTQANSKQQVT